MTKELDSILQIFRLHDDDGNGIISGDVMKGILQDIGKDHGVDWSGEKLNKLFDAADVNHDGMINYAEFLGFLHGEDGSSKIQFWLHEEGVQWEKSEVMLAAEEHRSRAHALVKKIKTLGADRGVSDADPLIAAYHSISGLPQLQGCAFVGHTATDLDSVASAVGAAYLFSGTAAAASDLNSETEFALEHWGIEAPRPYADIAAEYEQMVCLVDHNQVSQMAAGIDTKKVVGIIDHHAVQEGVVTTAAPIHIDIRPWGSACSIISQIALRSGILLPKHIAGILLSGILSDTLNLQSPTTTSWDRKVVAVLVVMAEVDDPDALASSQFVAKAKALEALSAHQIVCGDCKTFKVQGDIVVVWGTVETTDVPAMLKRKSELIDEACHVRAERDAVCIFVSIVDVVALRSFLFVAGSAEKSLAAAAFPDARPYEGDVTVLALGSRVSRKKDFIPPVSAAAAAGWQPPEIPDPPRPPLPLLVECTIFGCITRRCKTKTEAEEASVAQALRNRANRDD